MILNSYKAIEWHMSALVARDEHIRERERERERDGDGEVERWRERWRGGEMEREMKRWRDGENQDQVDVYCCKQCAHEELS